MNIRNTYRSEKENLSRIHSWDVGWKNKGIHWVPYPTYLFISSSLVRSSWSYDWSRLSFIGQGVILGPRSLRVAKCGRACVCRDSSTLSLLAVHSKPSRLPFSWPGWDARYWSGVCVNAAWGWFAGEALGSLHRPRIDWIRESRKPQRVFVAKLCGQALFTKGGLSLEVVRYLKLVQLFMIVMLIILFISPCRELQRGRKWGVGHRINTFPPTSKPPAQSKRVKYYYLYYLFGSHYAVSCGWCCICAYFPG